MVNPVVSGIVLPLFMVNGPFGNRENTIDNHWISLVINSY